MKDRNERLMAIRRLINASNISSQEELMALLEEQGFSMTQATLSRDLKYLRVAKMPDQERGYIYMLTEKQLNEPTENNEIPITGFVSIDFAQGMAVMKTLPGHAGSIAYTLDTLNSYEIAGTIAGDDTILIIPRDGVTKNDLLNVLRRTMPGFAGEQVN